MAGIGAQRPQHLRQVMTGVEDRRQTSMRRSSGTPRRPGPPPRRPRELATSIRSARREDSWRTCPSADSPINDLNGGDRADVLGADALYDIVDRTDPTPRRGTSRAPGEDTGRPSATALPPRGHPGIPGPLVKLRVGDFRSVTGEAPPAGTRQTVLAMEPEKTPTRGRSRFTPSREEAPRIRARSGPRRTGVARRRSSRPAQTGQGVTDPRSGSGGGGPGWRPRPAPHSPERSVAAPPGQRARPGRPNPDGRRAPSPPRGRPNNERPR